MNKIKELRKEKGLSQKELASMMHVGQSTVANWEKERRCPNILQSIRLTRILETTVEELFK